MSIALVHTAEPADTAVRAMATSMLPAVGGDASEPPVAPMPPPAKTASPDAPALIVLGRDDAGKTHASWFTADEAELATKAAGLMDMRVVEVIGDALIASASSLPHGRVFASGKAFVPFVKAATFDALAQHLPPAARAQLDRTRSKPAPIDATIADGDKLQPSGRAAKAAAKATTKGVLDRSAGGKAAASGAAGSTSSSAAAAGGSEAGGEQSTNNRPAPHLPTDWSEIAAGSLVLISEGEGHGWYEAIVIEAHEDELFTLGWRDWPDLPTLVRHRRHLGLLHPDHAAE